MPSSVVAVDRVCRGCRLPFVATHARQAYHHECSPIRGRFETPEDRRDRLDAVREMRRERFAEERACVGCGAAFTARDKVAAFCGLDCYVIHRCQKAR